MSLDNRWTRAAYDRSPIILRSVASSVFGAVKNRVRFRGDYPEWSALFSAARHWSEEELEAYQDECLAALVDHAVEFVPYYRRLFESQGLSARDVRKVSDLPRLPILEKEDLVREGDALLSESETFGPIARFPTSGSTGTPLVVPRTSRIEQMEWAFVYDRLVPDGARGEPYCTFSGLELLPPSRSKPPFWIDNWANRQRMFSIFHMNDETLPAYVAALDARPAKMYWGYPSAIYTIAEFMERKGLRLREPPEYVLAVSEELQPHYAECIERVFGSTILSRWGLNEFCGSITQYDCGHLHYDMDYAILEFLPVDDEESDDGCILAEVLGTNMHDHAWPLLRYRTGDLVEYHPEDRCEQGRPGQIVRRIHGRNGRYFELPNGSRITNISVIAKKCQNVRFMQVVQRERGRIIVRIVPDQDFSEGDAARVVDEFRKKVGDELEIDIEVVEDIARTRRGKFISIVNELDG